MKPPKATKSVAVDGWHDLRDERGKLCARLDTAAWVLEIRRSDRNLIARFDLRKHLVVLEKTNADGVE